MSADDLADKNVNVLFGGHELEASGEEITAITLDSNIVLFAGAHRDHEFRIEQPIEITREDGPSMLVQYEPYSHDIPIRRYVTELSAIVGERILHARAYRSGILELLISNQWTLTVLPDERYEAWMYTHERTLLACPPGGFRDAW